MLLWVNLVKTHKTLKHLIQNKSRDDLREPIVVMMGGLALVLLCLDLVSSQSTVTSRIKNRIYSDIEQIRPCFKSGIPIMFFFLLLIVPPPHLVLLLPHAPPQAPERDP